MNGTYRVEWTYAAWNDVLWLPVPPELRRTEIEILLDRLADTLAYWGEREPQTLGDLPWSWVREDQRLAQWHLGDWFRIFTDLRIFFFVPEGSPSLPPAVYVLAVQAEGARYVAENLDELLLRRRQVADRLTDGPGQDERNGGD
jgi:hypothetical protein